MNVSLNSNVPFKAQLVPTSLLSATLHHFEKSSFLFQVSLRQLDMKLLCQLWTLNESLQDYKKTLEDEENQREVASILESHLEEDEEDDELTANDNDEEESWQEDTNQISSAEQQGKKLYFVVSFSSIFSIGGCSGDKIETR